MGTVASFALPLLAITVIFPITHNPDQAEATPDASVSTVTITSSSSTANVDIVPTSSTGTFASSDTNSEVAFGVTTNNLTGYNLVIEGSDATGVLTNDNTGDTLTTIDSSTDETTFITGASSTYTNKWGIKPSKVNSVTNTNYLPAPTTTNTITMDTTDTSNPTTANNYTIGLGARIDYEKPSGTYTNTFNIQAVARPMMYEIVYSKGGLTDVSGTVPATESNTAAISGVTLSTTSMTRTTYTFAGWCDGTINTTTEFIDNIYYNPGTLCNGTSAYDTANPNPDVYPANTSFKFKNQSISTDSNNQATLIAVWKPTTFDEAYASVGATKSGNYYKMQDITYNNTTNLCAQVSDNQISTLRDTRDNQDYTVAKINGNCWMTRNLAIGCNGSGSTYGGSVSQKTLTNSNSNISASNWTTPTAGLNVATSTGSYQTCNSTYGAWYNYVAATAGTIGLNATTDVYNICPKNWTLPSYNQSLVLSNHANIFLPVTGGAYGNTVPIWSGKGTWWTSVADTSAGTTFRYHINYTSANNMITIGSSDLLNLLGFYIRCIAK